MDELMRPMSQFDAWMLTACLRVGFFVPIAMPATVLGVLCWVAGEHVGRRDSRVYSTNGATKMSDQEPVAWIVDVEASKVDHIYAVRLEAEQFCDWHLANFPHVNARIVPLYRLPAITDEQRQAVEAILDDPDLVLGDTREPLRCLLERLSHHPPRENDHIPDTGKMVTTLTNDERAAIAYAVACVQPVGNYDISARDTLCKLLERLKPSK